MLFFGVFDFKLLVIGFVLGVCGVNVIGCFFIGDFVGDFLYKIMFEFGFVVGSYDV